MTDRLLEQVFPGIADTDTVQTYDTPEGAAAALDAIEAELAATDRPAARTARTQDLVSDLDAAVDALVRRLLPEEEDLYAETAFTLEDDARLPITVGTLVEQLRHGETREPLLFRIADTTLETSIQAVLDSLTAQRITEELDAPTYVERLRGAFRRVRSGAASKKRVFAALKSVAERVVARLDIIARLDGVLRAQASEGEAAATLADDLDALTVFTRQSRAFAERVLAFSVISATSLERVEKDFCSDLNVAGAEGESVLVSREAEHHVLFRPAPILWALCVTVLAKIILAHNTSETLHVLAVPILVLTYGLTWGFSIFIGIWTRLRRMRDLQRHLLQQVRQVLHDPGTRDELIEFPHIDPSKPQPRAAPIAAYAYRGKITLNTMRVMRRNLLALVLPLILLGIVLVVRNGGDQRFMARFEGAAPCVLAEGRLVFATKNVFFVMPHDRVNGVWETALRRIFPEFFADVVPRDHIIRVKNISAAPRPADDVRDCSTIDPDRNTYTLTHVGSALDISGNTQSIENVALGLNSLVTALTTGDALTVDVNAALGSGPSVTVELGETSLDVLAQATAFGGPVAAASLNPVIVNARKTIALELSKATVADVDLEALFNALAIIRETIGNDASMEQTLTLAFGGINLTQPDLVVPDAILALFEGEDTLLAELRALRTASETSNTLVQTFLSAFEDGTDRRPSDPVVMAPIILDRREAQGPLTTRADIFQTSITIGDETTDLGTLGNALVLPVFTDPVKTGTGALNTVQGAFDWGRDTDRLRDPVIRDDGTTYFDRIARTIESCLVGDAVVTIDVLGLASRSWDGVPNGVANAALNYHLAEGRRLGALRKIADGIEDMAALDRVRVVGSNGTLALSAILPQLTPSAQAADLLPALGRFETIAAFEARRDTLLAVTGLSEDKKSPLEELFARSVVLQMVSTDGGPCAF